MLVANFYFTAEAALIAKIGAASLTGIDLEQCSQFTGQLFTLCEHAKASEEDWVNFKLFGMMGLTILFVLGQGFYLAKHMQQPEETESKSETNAEAHTKMSESN